MKLLTENKKPTMLENLILMQKRLEILYNSEWNDKTKDEYKYINEKLSNIRTDYYKNKLKLPSNESVILFTALKKSRSFIYKIT